MKGRESFGNILSSVLEPNRPRIGRFYGFKNLYKAHTPFGFIAPFTLSGYVQVQDEEIFRSALAQHKGDANTVVRLVVDNFYATVFRRLLAESKLFFLYSYTEYGYILLNLWAYQQQQDGSINIHICSYYSENGLNEQVKKALHQFSLFGCSIDVINFDCQEGNIGCIEENMHTIPSDVLTHIRENGVYLQLVERICMTALSERAKLFSEKKQHGREQFATLQTHLMGDVLHISWKNAKAAEGWSLLGFRRTHGFSANEFSDVENGVLIVDSAAGEGSTVEAALPRNEPLYYTFFLRRLEAPLFSSNRYYVYERVARFTETLPDADTVSALERQLEETRLRAKIAEVQRSAAEVGKKPLTFEEQRRSGIESQLRLAKDALGLLRAVDEIEADSLQELERVPGKFSEQRAQAWRDEVQDLCAKLRENVRRLV